MLPVIQREKCGLVNILGSISLRYTRCACSRPALLVRGPSLCSRLGRDTPRKWADRWWSAS